MRAWILASLVALGSSLPAWGAPKLDTSAWLKDYETAKAKSATDGRPILVVFR
jgi:hypothetical protein